MAADLSQGFECAAAAAATANGRRELTAAKALRSLRAVRRRPVQVVAGVVVTQLVETALANEAPGIMALSLVGPVNLGLVLAFLQLGLTAWSVLWYARYGKTSLDPQIKRHRVAFTSLENRLSTDLAAAELSGSFPVFTVFAVFVVCILLLSVGGSSGEDGLSEFYIGGRRISSAVNGFALFGGYMSAAAMLGNPGEIALTGYDGIAYTLAPAVAWVVLLLVAEPFHSTSLFTVGDSLALRLRSRPAHLAAGITTLVISLLYLIAQLVGAATLAAPILGMDGPGAQRVVVACLGLLMMLYVIIGGMRAATLVQSVKAVLLLAGGVFLALAVLSRFGWSPANLLNAAAHNSGYGDVFLRPGSVSTTAPVNSTPSVCNWRSC